MRQLWATHSGVSATPLAHPDGVPLREAAVRIGRKRWEGGRPGSYNAGEASGGRRDEEYDGIFAVSLNAGGWGSASLAAGGSVRQARPMDPSCQRVERSHLRLYHVSCVSNPPVQIPCG
ncbi:MAG: hypothetical protein QXI84_08260 [Thermofilaceae archaeon]